MVFKKGQSGNLSGRPKVDSAFRDNARKKCPKAFAVIVDLMENSEDERIKLSAAETIIERGYGKPMQATEITGADKAPIALEFIDRPPREDFQAWEARRKRELEKK